MTDVLVVDLGLGNLRSVCHALERAGATARVSSARADVAAATRIVVPGQGAFRDGARALATGGLGDALRERIAAGIPYLGLCLGMQLLFARSEEAPDERGLDVFPGHVARIAGDLRDPETGARLKVPHMGWNEVRGRHALLPATDWFYFVHSYVCVPDDAALVAATADYGVPLCAAVARGSLFACQFHPEKSQAAGAAVLARFLAGPPWN